MLYNLFTQVLSVEVLSGILKFGCSSIFGLSIYISHSIFLNRYLSNQNNLLTAIILPPIIYIITLAISTDLFLSLGMIGALSIVRYRTPVKSQYDLVLLLSLISIGITMGVNIKFGILTVLFLIFVAPLFYLFKKKFPQFIINETNETNKVLLMINVEENMSITSNILKNNGNILSLDPQCIGGKDHTNCCLQFDKMEDALRAQKSLSEKIKILSSNIGYQ